MGGLSIWQWGGAFALFGIPLIIGLLARTFPRTILWSLVTGVVLAAMAAGFLQWLARDVGLDELQDAAIGAALIGIAVSVFAHGLKRLVRRLSGAA